MTQFRRGLAHLALAAALGADGPLGAQQLDYEPSTAPPRLLLNERRLRLLKRERERESMRWQQFNLLMSGGARMPEPGFASALYGIVTGQRQMCRNAADWALSEAKAANPAHLRQMALVYDWCGESAGGSAEVLRKRIAPALAARTLDAQSVRSRVFAALALADDEPDASKAALKHAVEQWWKARTLPELIAGKMPFATRADLFAMVEFLHVIRDNLREDLREGARKWFEELPPLMLLSYYPQPWPAAENEYRIPVYAGSRDPDLREAALSRAAEMALVAYDANAQPHQFLQGWVMNDRFLMRGAFGIPYEFMWANPYQPGLSFTYMPDLFHSNGRLLVRSGWEEDATWFGLLDGIVQVFRHGQRIAIRPEAKPAPLDLGPVRIFFASAGLRFETGWFKRVEEEMRPVEEVAFIVGLDPGAVYDVEVDGEELDEARADRGGIVMLKFPPGHKAEVRLRKYTGAVRSSAITPAGATADRGRDARLPPRQDCLDRDRCGAAGVRLGGAGLGRGAGRAPA